jgi:amino acid transporter
MAIGALFSTASAINATLYGGANVSFTIARYGGLPALFRRRLWQRARGGLVFTAVLVALIGTLFDLEGIAIMGSAAFLVVYGAVNASHLRLLDETGARRSAVAGGLLGCIVVLGLLLTYLAKERPPALGALAALLIVGFGTDLAWCHYSKRLMSMRGD